MTSFLIRQMGLARSKIFTSPVVMRPVENGLFAMESAILAFCSTSRMVVPLLMSAMMEDFLDEGGAS